MDKEELEEIETTKAEYVMRHAPNTIKETDLGLDTLDLVKKAINEWIKEQQ
mgnify:FL=1|jgi:hypothetical protein|tara:strand:+ start:604 stop:756 length:153 start_codon:yes stop_codon:yes gene_type:complete